MLDLIGSQYIRQNFDQDNQDDQVDQDDQNNQDDQDNTTQDI